MHECRVIFKDSARVVHRLVKEKLIKLVADVVMLADVALRISTGISTQPMFDSSDRVADSCKASIETMGNLQIANEDPDERSQIVKGPIAIDQTLGHSQPASDHEFSIDVRIVNRHGCL